MSKTIRRIDDLQPDVSNANKGTERGRYMVEASLRDVGAGRSIVVDKEGRVIAGNKTLEAWADVGGEIEVVRTDGKKLVVVQREDLDLSDDTGAARKLAYYDNRAGEVGLEWDAEELFNSLNNGLDLSAMFHDDELDELLASLQDEPAEVADVPAQVDKAEELRQKWGTAAGQIWQIAQHFVICDDCREPDTWQRLLSSAGVDKVNGVFTSPPYAEQRKEQYGGVPADEYVEWWEAVQANVKANLANDGSFFVNIKEASEDYIKQTYVAELVVAMSKAMGWVYLDQFCWERAGIPGDPKKMGKFKNQWEPVFWWALTKHPKFRPESVMHDSDAVVLDDNFQPTLALSQGTGKNVLGERKIGKGKAYPGNRLRMGNADEALGHAAAFPVALVDFFVRAYSDSGDVWLDPFCGSGTTIVAAHQNERVGLGIEMLPKYLGVILERLQEVTGKTPVRVE